MTKTLTLKSVSIAPGSRTITVGMKYFDGETVLIDQDFSATYYDSEDLASAMSKIKDAMQEAIDKYKAEQTALADATLLLAVDEIESALEV